MDVDDMPERLENKFAAYYPPPYVKPEARITLGNAIAAFVACVLIGLMCYFVFGF